MGSQLDIKDQAIARMASQVAKARVDPNAYIELVARADGGHPVTQGPVHREWQNLMSEHERLIMFAAVGSGKAIAVSTEIPTPNGWVALGDLNPGDIVFDQEGNPTAVEWCSPVWTDHTCYLLTLADGVEVVADADHQWSVYQSQVNKVKRELQIKTTKEIAEDTFIKEAAPKWRVPLCKPVAYSEKELPIPPYVLGCWLGDGTSSNSAITCHEDDEFIIDECSRQLGCAPGKKRLKKGTRVYTSTLGGYAGAGTTGHLREQLRNLGLLNNKHIPPVYLQASVAQRRELLAGLMDTDGTVAKKTPRLEYCTALEQLGKDVVELTRSLGYAATLKCNESKLYGVAKKNRYRIGWSTKDQVFKLARKAERHAKCTGAYAVGGMSIVSCVPTNPVPVRCIGVASKHKTFLFGRYYTVTHNSAQLRWRLEWELGRNPNLRIGLVSSSQIGMPTKILSGIRSTIESSRAVRYVFPNLRPSVDQKKWGESAITVQRADNALDPSIQIFGIGGKVLGSRLDLIIVDDICNHDNTRTEILRDKTYDFVTGPLLSRFSGRGGRVWIIGNTWHKDDALHRLERTGDYKVVRYSAFKPDPNYFGDEEREVPMIPELWSLEGLYKRERSLGIKAKPLMRNILLSDDESRIKHEWVARCLDRGRGIPMVTTWDPSNGPTFTGVDLAVGNNTNRGDLTSIFTIALLPDGTRRILDIRSGRWTGPKTLDEIAKVHKAFGSIVYVESNGQQGLLHQFASSISVVPIKSHNTGLNKYDMAFGIESLGIEFNNSKWIIPATMDGQPATEELSAWTLECEAYTPTEHPGDRLIASWIAREAARKYTPSVYEDDLYSNMDLLAR